MSDATDQNMEVATVKGMREILTNVKPQPGFHKTKPKPTPVGAQATGFFVARDFSQFAALNKFDEVYPGIILGGESIARNIGELRRLGVTHVLNAAQGQKFAQIDTTAAYYKHDTWNIGFMGVQAMDVAKFQLSVHFEQSAEYIHNALHSGGKVYVHCFQGVSRSASLVLAYLMMYKQTPLADGIALIRKIRPIFPNDGFLRQLCELNNKLFVAPTQGESS